MEVRPGANPADVKNYDTDRLRHDFLIQDLFVADEIKTIYSQIDRIIVGAATPVNKELVLEAGAMAKGGEIFVLELSISLKEERWVSSISVATELLLLMARNITLSTRMVCT